MFLKNYLSLLQALTVLGEGAAESRQGRGLRECVQGGSICKPWGCSCWEGGTRGEGTTAMCVLVRGCPRCGTTRDAPFLELRGYCFCPHREPAWAAPLTSSPRQHIHKEKKTGRLTQSSCSQLPPAGRPITGEGWTEALKAIWDRSQNRKHRGEPRSEVSVRPGGGKPPPGAEMGTEGGKGF